jgi:hypothetical protein
MYLGARHLDLGWPRGWHWNWQRDSPRSARGPRRNRCPQLYRRNVSHPGRRSPLSSGVRYPKRGASCQKYCVAVNF